jgi:GLPGLI family protein
MKYLFTLALILTEFLCFSQNCYQATYKGLYMIPVESYTLQVDSTTIANMSLADSNWKETLLEKAATRIIMELNVTAQDSVTYVEAKITEQPYYVKINTTNNKLKRVGHTYYAFNEDENKYGARPNLPDSNYKVTGHTKTILGYECLEAVCLSDETQIIWFCKSLPSSISPGVYRNVPGAVLESKLNGCLYTATSIEPCK